MPILLIEDHEPNAQSYLRMLQAAGGIPARPLIALTARTNPATSDEAACLRFGARMSSWAPSA